MEKEINESMWEAARLVERAYELACDVCADNENIRSSDEQYYDMTMAWCYDARDNLKESLDALNRAINAMEN